MVHSRTQILISSHLFLHYSLMTHENHSILKMTWGANTAELCTEGQIFTPLELSAIQLWTIPLLISGHHCHSWGEGRVKQNTRNHSCYLSSPLAVWSKRKSWPKRRNCWVAAEQPSHSITRNTNKQTNKNQKQNRRAVVDFWVLLILFSKPSNLINFTSTLEHFLGTWRSEHSSLTWPQGSKQAT